MKTFSQSGQDKFVRLLTNYKNNGTFLQIINSLQIPCSVFTNVTNNNV